MEKLLIPQKYIDDSLISIQEKGGYFIYNYTQKCQFEKAWDDVTKMCRGIITDKEGNISEINTQWVNTWQTNNETEETKKVYT